MNMRTAVAAVAVGLAAVAFADPATLVVDRSGAAGAYVSIQAAVDAANAGDTILVKPGVYDNGFKTYTYTDDASVTHTFTNRVTLTKKLHLKAEGLADETVILGAWDGGTSTGIGPAAVRCVYVDSAGLGSVIEGFTIRDGNCHVRYKADGKTNITDVLPNRGGGITASSSANTAFFAVGCVFDHCSGFRGGALRYGSAIRCRFVNMQGSGACVGRGTTFVNCLIDGNKTDGGLVMESTLVNCTMVGNGGTGVSFNIPVHLYNSICVANNGYGASLTAAAQSEATSTLTRSVVFDVLSNDNPRRNFFKTPDHAVTNDDLVVFAPLFEDYRVLAGSAAEGLGDAATIGENLNVSGAAAPIDLYLDFNGAAIPKTGPINAGCIQATATAAGGCARFTGKVMARGHAVKQDNISLWAYSEKPIDIFKVSVDGQPFYWNAPTMRMPELDGGVYVGIPGKGVVTTNEAVMPTATLTVAKDGSAQYTTIQAALNAITDSNPRVILVAEGEYNDVGYKDSANGDSCIKLIRPVRIVGAGRGKSTIRGRKAETADGRGTGASRCVLFANKDVIQIVQGFTLTGGRCVGTGTEDADANSGGLALGGLWERQYLLDCELTDGYAYRGGAAKRVTLERCHVHGVKATGGAIVRPGRLRSSLVEALEGGGYMVDLQQVPVAASTIVSSAPSFTPNPPNTAAHKGNYNSIYYSKATGSAPALVLGEDTAGIVYYGKLSKSDREGTTPGSANVDPLFVNATTHDYRLTSCSPAITSGVADVANYWEDPCLSDLNGNPRLFVDGKPVPGAVQTVVEALNITADQGAEVTLSGLVAVEPGGSVTVMATSKDAQRTVVGFVVDGEKVPGGSWTYTAPEDGSWTLGGHAVKALLTSDWYVKPTGSNTANGWTPETAFATLTYAMSVARAGDTVHALEGVYTAGSEIGGGVDCRVVIKNGVSLVGDEGAEKTVIMGGEGVRPAAFAGSSGALRGVTLTGGKLAEDSDTDAKRGGGVWANNLTVTVSDCIISNNVCARGGAACYCTLVNCRIIGNKGAQTSGAAYYSTLYGCYVDKNTCGSGQLFRFPYGLYNCTLGADNPKVATVIADNMGAIENCAILCGTSSDAIAYARNCVVLESQKGRYGTDNIIPIADAAAAKLDADGRPAKDSPLVDAGGALAAGMPASDFFGTQWYYNGAPDIGACEHDWRGDYQADLGNCATVVAADPQVVETDEGKVLVKDGAITIRFTDETLKAKYRLPFQVTGTGTLTLKAGDEIVGTYTAADGAQTLTYKNKVYGNDLAFAYAPGENDAGGALLDAQSGGVSGLMVIVR